MNPLSDEELDRQEGMARVYWAHLRTPENYRHYYQDGDVAALRMVEEIRMLRAELAELKRARSTPP